MIECVPAINITFTPDERTMTCHLEQGPEVILKCDVTWTTETALAFVASHLKCNINSLQLFQEGLPVLCGDFISEYERLDFRIGFKAAMPGYVSFAPPEDTQRTRV